MSAQTDSIQKPSDRRLEMIHKFQCPGCAHGYNPRECEKFKYEDDGYAFRCTSHTPGTFASEIGCIQLGLPKGFNRVRSYDLSDTTTKISLFESIAECSWNYLHLPVWAMEEDGFLFVRVYMPRIDTTKIAVIAGATISQLPTILCPTDMAAKLSEID
jgi:hypothetical protein